MEGRYHNYQSTEPELWRYYMDWHKAERHAACFDYANLPPRWHEAQEFLSRVWTSLNYQNTLEMMKRRL